MSHQVARFSRAAHAQSSFLGYRSANNSTDIYDEQENALAAQPYISIWANEDEQEAIMRRFRTIHIRIDTRKPSPQQPEHEGPQQSPAKRIRV